VAVIDNVARTFAPLTGTEEDVAWGMLAFYRSTLLMKCQGLEDSQLRFRSVGPSKMTLLGLLRHMTEVERYWFQEVILGDKVVPYYGQDSEADFDNLDSTPVPEVVRRFHIACADSHTVAVDRSLDQDVPCEMFGKPVSIRFIAIHMVEEYARHCGHADLLREALDGSTGL